MKRKPVVTETPDSAGDSSPQLPSSGEGLFNWITYGGIAGIGTFFAGIPITYWAKYSKSGSRLFEKATHALTKTGLSADAAEKALITTALMQGGNAMIPPVKIMESHKQSLVRKFNRMLGQPEDGENIRNEPKQSWGSLIKARLLAWGVVFGSFEAATQIVGSDKFEEFEDKFSEHVICKPLGKPIFNAAGEETVAFRCGKMAALDVFATTSAAILLFVGSRFFARRNKNHDAVKKDLTQLVPLRQGESIFNDDAQGTKVSSSLATSVKPMRGYMAAVSSPADSHADSVTHTAPALVPGL